MQAQCGPPQPFRAGERPLKIPYPFQTGRAKALPQAQYGGTSFAEDSSCCRRFQNAKEKTHAKSCSKNKGARPSAASRKSPCPKMNPPRKSPGKD